MNFRSYDDDDVVRVMMLYWYQYVLVLVVQRNNNLSLLNTTGTYEPHGAAPLVCRSSLGLSVLFLNTQVV